MSFDSEFMAEAEKMFERVVKLERSVDGGKTWALLQWGPIAEAVYSDKSRAGDLAGPFGVKLTDGSQVRFLVP